MPRSVKNILPHQYFNNRMYNTIVILNTIRQQYFLYLSICYLGCIFVAYLISCYLVLPIWLHDKYAVSEKLN